MPHKSQPAVSDRLRLVTSRSNARVKELRRMFHEAALNECHEIAVEGWHLVQEAINSGLRVSAVFFSKSTRERATKLLLQLPKHAEAFVLPDEVFASAVPTETPQGIAAMVQVKNYSLADVLRGQPALLVVATGLQDPGNLGTIARSAEAFGATGLIVTDNTVSEWNWKSVRASAGSLFRLPVVKAKVAALVSQLKSHGVALLATSSHKGMLITGVDLSRSVALMVGNEGAGLSKTLLQQADEIIAIPQAGAVESLNAAIAASVMLYEASRQRRKT
jgi:TrmH family RNA methyltransferase